MVSRGRTTATAGTSASRSPTTSTSATRTAGGSKAAPSKGATRSKPTTTRKTITQSAAGQVVQAQFKQAVSSAVASVGIDFGVPTVKTTVQETPTEIITITEKPEVIEEVIEEPVIEEPIIELPELIPEVSAEPDRSITDNMVTQQVINFNIINGRAVGSIKFVATNNFNPYYYNKNIVNIIQIKDPNGVVLLTKENRLNFTETERDEVINYDEDVKQNTRATIESFVWSSATTPTAFSKKFTIEISDGEEPAKPLTSGFMGAGVAGAIAGLILIGFIADHKRGK